jgi:hypothetical protein
VGVERDYAEFNKILKPILGEDVEVNAHYLSPIPDRTRGKSDTRPSLIIREYTTESGPALFWFDGGFTGQKGHRPAHLLAYIKGITRAEADAELSESVTIEGIDVKRRRRPVVTYTRKRKLSEEALRWWGEYNITEAMLKRFRVASASALFMDSDKVYNALKDPLAFIYEADNGFQFYSPDPKKFIRNGKIILGYEQLPFKGDALLITAGMKDGLAVVESSGIPFLAGSRWGVIIRRGDRHNSTAVLLPG